ncbi:phosphatidylethanolamine-binding protein 4 [Osmerus eperlanus]|uniref:phosphatidylethanolamine-binding protein 4 n=1 Tax=Osmerus eperlanus TaxID=29151 RepID=UPI002E0FC8B1
MMLGPKLLAFSAALLGCPFGVHQITRGTSESDFKPLSRSDASFCNGGLQVSYPDLDISKCLVISRENQLREKISQEWGAPRVRLNTVDKGKKYALMMVDPDAPNRSKPTQAHWRHWLVVDIEGASLRRGEVRGTTLSDYSPPTPPQKSGLHRYQFLVYEQPANQRLILTKMETSSMGNWDPQDFARRFHLGQPVAAVQFLTQNHRD